MKSRQVVALMICGGLSMLLAACATKGFVRETETRLGQRVDSTDAKLRETADRTSSNTQALEATGQRLGEVGTLAKEAKTDAERVAAAQKEAEATFNRRFANRNTYAMIDTKSVFFDFDKADLRDEGINDLEDVAKALKTDPNAVLELQGFADPRGTDRYNYLLTRDRVDAVVRHLVQRHNIDVRRIAAVGMGKIALAAGQKGDKDTFAKSRRVDIRLLSPQS
jgi:outer membrane protein OmpA-like peptidoglycan-associated protein